MPFMWVFFPTLQVRRALGDFRRTHEEAGMAEVRALLSPEEWEAIQEVEAPASYYV